MRVPIFQVDAFASKRFAGNPAAVMPLIQFFEDDVLQSIAAENNLSETAFIVPSGDDYVVRWFTPAVEVPLCGHATLASAAVVMERLRPNATKIVFNSASGPLPVEQTSAGYALDFPARPAERIETPSALTLALGCEPSETYINSFNYMAVLDTPDVVRRAAPDMAAVAALDRPGVIITAPGDNGYDCVSRYFAPAKGVPEDPVTGAAHCMIAPFWSRRNGRPNVRAFQASRRGGELRCQVADNRVRLEGSCVFYLEGEVEI